MAIVTQLPIASAPIRRQGFARSARRLMPPLTATGAPAWLATRHLHEQMLHSSTTGSNTEFLTAPRHLMLAKFHNKLFAVVALVGSQGYPALALDSHQLNRRLNFRAASGLGYATVHRQPWRFHQHSDPHS